MPNHHFSNTARDRVIIKRVASFLPNRDIQSIALVSKWCNEIARPILFKSFTFNAYNNQHTVDDCLTFLREHASIARCITVFSLRGRSRMPLPELSLPVVYDLLQNLPSICRLQLSSFRWMEGHIVSKPLTPHLNRLRLASIVVPGAHDSPLGILDLVPAWDSVHVNDIEHTTEPIFLNHTKYRCATLFLDHEQWADPAHSLPAYSMKFRGVELLIANYIDITHALMFTQLVQGSCSTLRSITIVLNHAQCCGESSMWLLAPLRACSRLNRFTISVPLDFKVRWNTPSGVFQDLHSRLLTHFVNNLPHSCQSINLHLGLIGPKLFPSLCSFMSVEWDEIGEAFRRLPALDSIFIHLDGYDNEPVPTWNAMRLRTVCKSLHPFLNYRFDADLRDILLFKPQTIWPDELSYFHPYHIQRYRRYHLPRSPLHFSRVELPD